MKAVVDPTRHPVRPEDLDAAVSLLAASKRPAALTGAGMSAESGLATFRGTDSSLWSRWAPEDLATPRAYRESRELVWGWYVWRMGAVARAQPNAGHLALAAMGQRWPEFAVVTQNVDDWHERAGSTRITHLHGGLFEHRCFACARSHPGFEIPADAVDKPQLRLTPPRCLHCGGYIRPGVVWFGEQMPQEPWRQATVWMKECDLLLVIGTSAVVQPAASLVGFARQHGAKVVLVNPEDTGHSSLADVHLKAGAAEVLPLLLDRISTQGQSRL